MKTKVLILGAEPPFQGPWVPLDKEEKWWSHVHTIPTVEVNGECRVEVVDEHGSIISLPLGEEFRGVKVRGVVGTLEGVTNVSVLIEERSV